MARPDPIISQEISAFLNNPSNFPSAIREGQTDGLLTRLFNEFTVPMDQVSDFIPESFQPLFSELDTILFKLHEKLEKIDSTIIVEKIKEALAEEYSLASANLKLFEEFDYWHIRLQQKIKGLFFDANGDWRVDIVSRQGNFNELYSSWCDQYGKEQVNEAICDGYRMLIVNPYYCNNKQAKMVAKGYGQEKIAILQQIISSLVDRVPHEKNYFSSEILRTLISQENLLREISKTSKLNAVIKDLGIQDKIVAYIEKHRIALQDRFLINNVSFQNILEECFEIQSDLTHVLQVLRKEAPKNKTIIKLQDSNALFRDNLNYDIGSHLNKLLRHQTDNTQLSQLDSVNHLAQQQFKWLVEPIAQAATALLNVDGDKWIRNFLPTEDLTLELTPKSADTVNKLTPVFEPVLVATQNLLATTIDFSQDKKTLIKQLHQKEQASERAIKEALKQRNDLRKQYIKLNRTPLKNFSSKVKKKKGFIEESYNVLGNYIKGLEKFKQDV